MKKQYIIPATIITEATSHEIICTSMHGTIRTISDDAQVFEEWFIGRSQPGKDGDEADAKERGWEVFGEE